MVAEEPRLRYVHSGEIARLTMLDGNRGNSLDLELMGALVDAVQRSRSDGARVLVVQAEGRFFSVGGDLKATSQATDPSRYIDDLAHALHRVVAELIEGPAITVSVVQGPAAGAGFPLAACVDIVLAGQSARFSIAYSKVGLSIDGGSSSLVHSLGLHRTLRLALLREELTADDAFEAGLVARVFPDDELQSQADEIIDQLAAGPRGAQAAIKRLIRDAAGTPIVASLRNELVSIRVQVAGPDGQEGVAAFLEKRSPHFQ